MEEEAEVKIKIKAALKKLEALIIKKYPNLRLLKTFLHFHCFYHMKFICLKWFSTLMVRSSTSLLSFGKGVS